MAEIIENVKSNMVIRGDETKAEHLTLCWILFKTSHVLTKDTFAKWNDSCLKCWENLMDAAYFDKIAAISRSYSIIQYIL
jgi:hypothetical protein